MLIFTLAEAIIVDFYVKTHVEMSIFTLGKGMPGFVWSVWERVPGFVWRAWERLGCLI